MRELTRPQREETAGSARRRKGPLAGVGVVVASLLALAASGSTPAHRAARFDALRGFVVTHATEAPDSTGYGSPRAAATLDEIVAVGGNAVLLVPLGFQTSHQTPFVEPSAASDWSTNDERLRAMIRAARARGLDVVLEPRIVVRDGRGADIEMRDGNAWRKWFEEYRRFLLPYARLAQEEGVAALSIGHGLDRTTGHDDEWRRSIRETRRLYRGELGYSAGGVAAARAIRWWAELDWVGIALQEALAEKADADEEQLAEGARALLRRALEVAQTVGRPLLVTEAGFRSVRGCFVQPWDTRAAALDEGAQAAAYRALLAASTEYPDPRRLRGLFWGELSSDPNPDRRGHAASRSPLGKQAMQAVKTSWWSESAAITALPPPSARGYRGVVVSSDTLATEVGVAILGRGGNAVDAAVATAFALAVTFPEAGNLGGGGFLLAQEPGKRAWGLDFREMAPLAAQEDLYVVWAMRADSTASRDGVRAAGIPGTVAGLYEAWQRAGRLPWSELVRPARRLAEQGFRVGEKLPEHLDEKRARLLASSMARSLFFRGEKNSADGQRTLRPREALVQPELARVLLAIEEGGARAFYQGEVAEALVEEVVAAGGIWTRDDFRHYRARVLEPVEIAIDGRRTLITLPPPSSGSVVLGQAFYFLRQQRAERMAADGPDRARALIESLRLAFADRNAHLGDPAVMRVAPQELLRPGYLRRRAAMLPRFGAGDSDRVAAGEPAPESNETTHLVVFDQDGGCVSLTTTLNSLFGCGWASPSTGILLNNQMDDFDTRPGRPNLYGLVGTGVNRVRPGARMLSSMAPCIVADAGQPTLAIGGRGGPRILTAILQVLLYRLWDDMPLGDAMEAPRLHHQWLPDRVELEPRRQWPNLWRQLEAEGYVLQEATTFGQVHAAERLPDGSFLGVADPREHGLARAIDAN